VPTLDTRFGPLEYDESATLEFPAGLAGFERLRTFLLVDRADLRPIVFLQSVEEPALCFLAMPAQSVVLDYQLHVSDEELALIEAGTLEGLLALAIVCTREDQSPTANLLGPVVVNQSTRKAVQAIRDDSVYSAYHPFATSCSKEEVC
jgi:flagellar assembly factor FliW